MDIIKEHYKQEAEKYKDSKQSTMRDINIRDIEINRIINVLNSLKKFFKKPAVLEIGCGNGYLAEKIIQQSIIKPLICIDFCEEFIEIAKERKIKDVTFRCEDVLNLDFENESFDIIFSERCLINLLSWEKQKKAIEEMRRVLKSGGYYIMIECFSDGLNNLNEARKTIGLDTIPAPYHNLHFDYETFLQYIKKKFTIIEEDTEFLSTYYYGSRVLYPAIIKGKKKLIYNNKFVEFFKYLPGYGNYSPIQLFVLQKNNKGN